MHGGCVVSILASLDRSSSENTTFRLSSSHFARFQLNPCLCVKDYSEYGCPWKMTEKCMCVCGLQNKPCDPCMVHCCLHWCALCQEHREMQGRLSDNLVMPMTVINPPEPQEMGSRDTATVEHKEHAEIQLSEID